MKCEWFRRGKREKGGVYSWEKDEIDVEGMRGKRWKSGLREDSRTGLENECWLW